ncbi:MAG TPA: DNA topoisomerase, partial [Crocinitomicaceae bacterium]|nr:DNA topoisomerase [Crocinitomicaceae bacterium]
EKVMPIFQEGEIGEHVPRIHHGKTSPPKPYTEATLLRAMETAGKQVEDEEMRELLKDNGIGRPSTRANIIETLFKRKYIEKKKKNLYATVTGIGLIDTIQNELLKSPELTGQWERKLRLIEKGEYQVDLFKKELVEVVVDLTNEVLFNTNRVIHIVEDKPEPEKKKTERAPKEDISIEELNCPKCKQNKLMKGNTAYGCSNFKECGFKIPFIILGKKLTDKQLADLIQKGKTTKIKGFVFPNSDTKKDACLLLDETFNVQME